MRVIAVMLGLPEEEGDRFRTWIHEILEVGITRPDVLMKAIGETTKYFQAEVEKRRAAPRDDLISQLMDAKIDGAADHRGSPARRAAADPDRRHRHDLERDRLVLLASGAAPARIASGLLPSRT